MFELTVIFTLFTSTLACNQLKFETIFEWNFINYNWPSAKALVMALKSGEYIPENNPILGIKLWKNSMYLTIPRFEKGVPVTLAVTSATPVDGRTNPMLDPYPNWEMQTIGNCSAFQFVQSMEIDPLGRMWVIDTGRTELSTSNPVARCPPRLVILDLENNGAVLRTYEFPESVTSRNSTYLNDIAIDHQGGGWAFITDSESLDPGIIVYSLEQNASWKVRHRTMEPQLEATRFTVAGTEISSSGGVNGITLSPPGGFRMLYYSPLPSFHLYSIPVSVLKISWLKTVNKYVVDQGKKSSQTGGMVMSNRGILYFGLMNDDSIATWDTGNQSTFSTGYRKVFTDHTRSQWPDTFAFDNEGRLWYVANALQIFQTGIVDITKPNYRVLRATVHANSYQYLRDGTAPELAEIAAPVSHADSSMHQK